MTLENVLDLLDSAYDISNTDIKIFCEVEKFNRVRYLEIEECIFTFSKEVLEDLLSKTVSGFKYISHSEIHIVIKES